MIDIVSVGNDINVLDSQVPKAVNILSIQLESLEYAKGIGIDLKYFLSEEFIFQNESFKAYLIERLANQGINVATVMDTLESLFAKYTFNISQKQNDTALVAR